MIDNPPKQHKFSIYFYNRTTYIGVFLAFIVFFIECLLFGIDFFNDHHNVYLGLVTYTLLPPFLLLGLFLIPIGALKKYRGGLKGKEVSKPIYVNFSNPKHRNAFFIFIAGTTILIIMSAIGSYQAFHYTESVHFCGITCHEVMEPQYTRYMQSAHARVKCVECHIGEGADWYVRSKFSGVRQVFATIGNTYSRPIPTPIHNLRPAEETCEKCHWPEKFYSSFEVSRQYFPTGEAEHSSWFLRMLIQMGSSGDSNRGIHSHMNIDNDIYYYAEDEKRQEITWVKSVDKNGNETIYTSPDSKYKEKEPVAELIRKMDCIDCHNRPTHRFWPPYKLVNLAMQTKAVDPTLPGIKAIAVDVLSADYATKQEAAHAIEQALVKHFQKEFGEEYNQHKEKVDNAVKAIVSVYGQHFFPKMKARWDSYPENIGHLLTPGCFRCHGGEHTSKEGKIISRDCTVCHSIIEQGPPGNLEKSTDGLPFRHPVDIGEAWKDMNCYECHATN